MLLRQTVLYLPAQVIGPIVQFISVIAWTHFLQPEQMGLFALITAAQELIFTGTLFWFSLYTVRHHSDLSEAAAKTAFLETEAGVLIGSSVLALAVAVSLPLFIGAELSAELIAATALYAITRGIATQLSERARAEHDPATYSLLQIVWPIAGFLFALLLLYAWKPTASAVLWGYVAAQIATLALAIPRLGFAWGGLRLNRQILQNAINYGLPLVIGGFFVWAANNGIRFVLEWKEGAAAVGLIAVGLGLGLRVANVAAMSVTAAAFPLAVRRAREHGISAGQEQLVQNGTLLMLVLLPATVGLTLIGPPLIELLVAEPYQEITKAILPLTMAAGAARNFRMHFGEQIFLLREETMLPLYNDAIDAAFTLIGTLAGLAYFGLPGAIAGAAAGAVASLAITLVWGYQRHKFAMRLSPLLRIGAAALVMAGAVWAFDARASWVQVLSAVTIGVAVYAAIIALLFPELRGIGLRALGLVSRNSAA